MALITEAYKREYTDGFYHLASQNESIIAPFVRRESGMGESISVDRVGSVDASEVVNLGQSITANNPDHTRRLITSRDYQIPFKLFGADIQRLAKTPQNDYQRRGVQAYNRERDRIIAAAMIGSALSGKDGGSSTALPATQIDSAGGDLTASRLLDAAEAFASNNVMFGPGNPLHVVIGPKQLRNLQDESTIINKDFNSSQPLADGTLISWNVFMIHVSNILTTESGGDRQCIAWHPDGVSYWEPKSMEMSADIQTGENGRPLLLNHTFSAGAVRLEESMVYEIQCTE